jgi:hypothetical protein
MNRQQYIGPIPHLRGRTAKVQARETSPGQVMAQFEDAYLMEARGWWQFAAGDFQVRAPR